MNTIVKKIIVGISSLLALGVVTSFEGDAKAGTATSNLSVSASVSANCTISTSALAFGAYDPVSANAAAPLDGTGGVTVTCTQGASTTITLGQGATAKVASTDAAPLRQMTDGGASRLEYFIYQDAGHSTVWGNTVGTSAAHTGTGTSTNITAYGRVTAGQNVPSGSYTDTVVATVTF